MLLVIIVVVVSLARVFPQSWSVSLAVEIARSKTWRFKMRSRTEMPAAAPEILTRCSTQLCVAVWSGKKQRWLATKSRAKPQAPRSEQASYTPTERWITVSVVYFRKPPLSWIGLQHWSDRDGLKKMADLPVFYPEGRRVRQHRWNPIGIEDTHMAGSFFWKTQTGFSEINTHCGWPVGGGWRFRSMRLCMGPISRLDRRATNWNLAGCISSYRPARLSVFFSLSLRLKCFSLFLDHNLLAPLLLHSVVPAPAVSLSN